jgi:DNA-binding transcriptional LysR family regulator
MIGLPYQRRRTVDTRQLRYFLAVVDAGSVHRAAEQLYVAQP